MKKALFLIIIIGIIAIMVFQSIAPVAASPAPTIMVDAATEQHILQSTIQIAMYEFETGSGVEAGGRGLGTVVRYQGQTLIVTHDHWSHINANLKDVEIRNAQGSLLVSLNAVELQNLIQYRDGGTLILTAPAGLESIVPATMAAAGTAQSGDMLLLARRSPANNRDTVEVVSAKLEAVNNGSGPAFLKMTGNDKSVFIPGDSGGGVWMNGQLVANNWSSGLMITQTWFDRLIGSEQVSQTSTINAAINPIGQLTTANDLTIAPDTSSLESKILGQ